MQHGRVLCGATIGCDGCVRCLHLCCRRQRRLDLGEVSCAAFALAASSLPAWIACIWPCADCECC